MCWVFGDIPVLELLPCINLNPHMICPQSQLLYSVQSHVIFLVSSKIYLENWRLEPENHSPLKRNIFLKKTFTFGGFMWIFPWVPCVRFCHSWQLESPTGFCHPRGLRKASSPKNPYLQKRIEWICGKNTIGKCKLRNQTIAGWWFQTLAPWPEVLASFCSGAALAKKVGGW